MNDHMEEKYIGAILHYHGSSYGLHKYVKGKSHELVSLFTNKPKEEIIRMAEEAVTKYKAKRLESNNPEALNKLLYKEIF